MMDLTEYSELALNTATGEMPEVIREGVQLMWRLSRDIEHISGDLNDTFNKLALQVTPGINPLAWGYVGIIGEAGEVLDFLKKFFLHQKTMNPEILADELGDTIWYWNYTVRMGYKVDAVFIETLHEYKDAVFTHLVIMWNTILDIIEYFGLQLHEILEDNINKLAKRYDKGFEESEYNE